VRNTISQVMNEARNKCTISEMIKHLNDDVHAFVTYK